MPTDNAEACDLFVAMVVAAQCTRLCQIFDQMRDFLERGSAGESEARSPSDLEAARQSVESRIMRISITVSAFSSIGLDAEIGDLVTSKLIRCFWGTWTPRQLAELSQCLENPSLASFKVALTRLRPLIQAHDLLHRYLIDVRNHRSHGPEVNAFLQEQLGLVEDDSVALTTLHDQGYCITLAGAAEVLGKSSGHARRILRELCVPKVNPATSQRAHLYDIESFISECQGRGVTFRDSIPSSFSRNSQLFCLRAD